MKRNKLTALISIMLCLVIASAYATWTYSTTVTGVAENTTTAGITLEGKVEQTVEGGTIKIDTSGLTVKVDDDGRHNAELTIEGSATISFTPTSSDVTSGVWLTCEAKDNCTSYKNGNVFKYTNVTSSVVVGDGQNGRPAAWTLSAEELKSLIALNGTITAATIEDYNNLQTAINGKTITITVKAAGDTSAT